MIAAHGGSSSNQQQNVDKTLKAIRSCGISFDVMLYIISGLYFHVPFIFKGMAS